MVDLPNIVECVFIFDQAQCFSNLDKINEFLEDLSSSYGTGLVASLNHLKHVGVLHKIFQ